MSHDVYQVFECELFGLQDQLRQCGCVFALKRSSGMQRAAGSSHTHADGTVACPHAILRDGDSHVSSIAYVAQMISAQLALQQAADEGFGIHQA